MKKKWLILPFITLTLILVFTLLPASFLSANPSNLVKNGDFQAGDLSGWTPEAGSPGFTITDIGGGNFVAHTEGVDARVYASILQIISVPTPNLNFSYKIKVDSPMTEHVTVVELVLHGGSVNLDHIKDEYNAPTSGWVSANYNLLQRTHVDISTLDTVWLRVYVSNSDLSGNFSGSFDDFKLEAPGGGAEEATEPVWVRSMPMTCWQIYVNEEGNFEFIFWWEYANNNWVSIYDSQGNLVYRESFPYGEPIVEVNLPDGMYTVKTFHEEGNILQEFVIGK